MGAAVTIPGFYILNRRWPYFRSLPLQLKALGAVIVLFPMISIRAEHRMHDFERLHWCVALCRYRSAIYLNMVDLFPAGFLNYIYAGLPPQGWYR